MKEDKPGKPNLDFEKGFLQGIAKANKNLKEENQILRTELSDSNVELGKLRLEIQPLRSENDKLRECLEKADLLSKAAFKLLNDLAKDGTAIEGFIDAYNIAMEYNAARYNLKIENLLTPIVDKPE